LAKEGEGGKTQEEEDDRGGGLGRICLLKLIKRTQICSGQGAGAGPRGQCQGTSHSTALQTPTAYLFSNEEEKHNLISVI
jgi:hypothetical protein